MSRACESCQIRPHGLEGHEDIELHGARAGDGRPLFHCRKCGTFWTRVYEGSGVFIWLPFEDPPT